MVARREVVHVVLIGPGAQMIWAATRFHIAIVKNMLAGPKDPTREQKRKNMSPRMLSLI